MATNQAMKYKEKGNAFFKKGDMQQAIENYTYACELDPNNCIFYTNRATAYAKMGKWDKVLRDASKSVKLNSKWEKGYYRQGTAYMALEQYAEAVKAFEGATDLQPSNETFKAELAKAKRAIMKGKSSAEIAKMEGNEYFKAGKGEAAIKAYTRAVKCCDLTDDKDKMTYADILANRAACYRQLYNADACVADCTEALKYNPRHAKAYIRRAQSYESLEKFKEALKDFEQANMLAPGVSVAVQGAARIRTSLRRNKQM